METGRPGSRAGRFSEHLIQFVLLAGTVAAVWVAFETWQSEIHRRRVETTLGYLKDLTDQTYVTHLWELQSFAMCVEKATGKPLSLLTQAEIAADRPALLEQSRRFWRLVEGGGPLEGVEKPKDVEQKVYYVYARISLMASCLESGLCDYATFDRMSDAAEIETLLSISNYLKLSAETSVEWNVSEDLERFLDRAYDHFSKRPGFMAGRQRVREKNCT